MLKKLALALLVLKLCAGQEAKYSASFEVRSVKYSENGSQIVVAENDQNKTGVFWKKTVQKDVVKIDYKVEAAGQKPSFWNKSFSNDPSISICSGKENYRANLAVKLVHKAFMHGEECPIPEGSHWSNSSPFQLNFTWNSSDQIQTLRYTVCILEGEGCALSANIETFNAEMISGSADASSTEATNATTLEPTATTETSITEIPGITENSPITTEAAEEAATTEAAMSANSITSNAEATQKATSTEADMSTDPSTSTEKREDTSERINTEGLQSSTVESFLVTTEESTMMNISNTVSSTLKPSNTTENKCEDMGFFSELWASIKICIRLHIFEPRQWFGCQEMCNTRNSTDKA